MSSHLHGRLAQLQKSIYIHLPLIMRIIILDLLSLNNMLKVYDKIWKFCGDTNHGVVQISWHRLQTCASGALST